MLASAAHWMTWVTKCELTVKNVSDIRPDVWVTAGHSRDETWHRPVGLTASIRTTNCDTPEHHLLSILMYFSLLKHRPSTIQSSLLVTYVLQPEDRFLNKSRNEWQEAETRWQRLEILETGFLPRFPSFRITLNNLKQQFKC